MRIAGVAWPSAKERFFFLSLSPWKTIFLCGALVAAAVSGDAGVPTEQDSTKQTKAATGVRSPETKNHQLYTNRLIHEKRPYLRLHAHNPVNWYPWGEEAFTKAKRENKPIFLSVGYYTCHWCHVMERESYSNPEIAAVVNGVRRAKCKTGVFGDW